MTVETRPAETPAVSMPATKTVADVLRHAALIIEERGWSDDEPLCEDGRRCAGGALSFVVTGEEWNGFHPLVERAAEALLGHLGRDATFAPMGGVAGWNDTPGRTASEVTAALRAAADAWEADR